MKAFVENNNIFCTNDESLIPKLAEYVITVPDNTTPDDLIFRDNTLRLKTESEKEADRIAREKEEAKMLLAETDIKMIRVIEDVIDIFITKKVINYKDLPETAQEKLNERKLLREKLK